MKISSRTTYLLPFIILLGASFWMVTYWSMEYFGYYDKSFTLPILLSLILSAGLYFGLRKLILYVNAKYLKIILLVVPLLLEFILSKTTKGHFSISYYIFPILFGGLLYFSFILFHERYIATLTDKLIRYNSLLGQTGEIPLGAITKLEQKKNMLSVLSSRFGFLNMAKKTSIAYCDENLDEYEISIYMPVFGSKEIFNKIIEEANECGNLKIRQYVV